MKMTKTICAVVFFILGLTLMAKACFFDTEVPDMIRHTCLGCLDLVCMVLWFNAADKDES